MKGTSRKGQWVVIVGVVLVVLVGGIKLLGNKPMAKGFAWQATKDCKQVVLIGTIHATRNTHDLVNQVMKEAMKEGQMLSVEVNYMNQGNMQKVLANRHLPAGETIADYLSEQEIAKLTQILQPLLNEEFTKEAMETASPVVLCTLMSSLSASESQAMGQGVDSLLLNVAYQKSIPINEIESVEEAIEVQNQFYSWDTLRSAIKNFDKDAKSTDAMDIENAYMTGDVAKAEEMIRAMKTDDPKGYKILLSDRNIKMADRIDQLVMDGRKHVIAVGSLHYMGEDGILSLLRQKGYTIKKLS